jgi:hypothetical protein
MTSDSFKQEGTLDVFVQPGSPLFPQAGDRLDTDAMTSPMVFSATDMTAYVSLPTKKVYKLGSLALVSISTHRDKFPVTGLGSIKIRGITAGHRMVGGTLVFSSYDRYVWYRMIEGISKKEFAPITSVLPDNLPPFDITIVMVNEEGIGSMTGLLGVSLLDEGETYSLDNIAIMESYSYMAVDRIPLQPIARLAAQRVSQPNTEENTKVTIQTPETNIF